MPGSIRSSTTRSGCSAFERGERGRTVGGERDRVAGALEVAADDVADGWIVVDDEHALPHAASVRPAARRAHAPTAAVRVP